MTTGQIKKILSGIEPKEVSNSFYRFVSLKYRKNIVDGLGSFKTGGRYNPKQSFPAVYLSSSSELALKEATSGLRKKFDVPFIMVSVEFKLIKVLDLTDIGIRRKLKIKKSELLEPWRCSKSAPLTHILGFAAKSSGYEGILYPSAVLPKEFNLVLFPDNYSEKTKVTICDKDNTLK